MPFSENPSNSSNNPRNLPAVPDQDRHVARILRQFPEVDFPNAPQGEADMPEMPEGFGLARRVFGLAVELAASQAEVARLTEENKRLKELIMTDPLTGIGTRRLLDTSYARLTTPHPLRRSDETIPASELTHAGLMIDADHFKHINDTYGHSGGDEVLRGLGLTIKSLLRDRDVIGRYGGEEIAVILPRTDLDEAEQIGEKIRGDVERADFGGRRIKVTVSIGVGRLLVAKSLSQGLIEADAGVYAAKARGRNRVVRGDRTSIDPSRNRPEIEF